MAPKSIKHPGWYWFCPTKATSQPKWLLVDLDFVELLRGLQKVPPVYDGEYFGPLQESLLKGLFEESSALPQSDTPDGLSLAILNAIKSQRN